MVNADQILQIQNTINMHNFHTILADPNSIHMGTFPEHRYVFSLTILNADRMYKIWWLTLLRATTGGRLNYGGWVVNSMTA